ncbi:MAG: 5-(carboxyamino)imidazole ribonucleotide synthase [Caldilineaceae bacterium]|nr:5-(carboxyamino)imidazole ribonucleotide synthase [Caldilineaceae bacterium]
MTTNKHQPILPGATIGVFGSGQLGRMMALAARPMGYRIHTYSPDRDSPTGQVADREVVADYENEDALADFVRHVQVVTFEFENVPALVAKVAEAAGVPVRPGATVLHTAQQRAREKQFLASAGLPVAPFALVTTQVELEAALAQVGTPAVLKTAAFGYDGKGQVRIDEASQAGDAWATLGGQPAVLEAFISFQHELSVVAARGLDDSFAHYGALENIHRNHILDLTIAPARIPGPVAAQAVELARAVLEKMDVVGVLCVEFFWAGDGRLLINELAPRPHNSGHLTIEAALTSQFEQQVRAICGLPLGSTTLVRPAAMANLLGDLWRNGEPDWAAAYATPGVKLHLYGKQSARIGRKMGHLTAIAPNVEDAIANVLAARRALQRDSALSDVTSTGQSTSGGRSTKNE